MSSISPADHVLEAVHEFVIVLYKLLFCTIRHTVNSGYNLFHNKAVTTGYQLVEHRLEDLLQSAHDVGQVGQEDVLQTVLVKVAKSSSTLSLNNIVPVKCVFKDL